MERIIADKLAILRRCKMEEIDIPFLYGKALNECSIDVLEVFYKVKP